MNPIGVGALTVPCPWPRGSCYACGGCGCVCVCVGVRERERERERGGGESRVYFLVQNN